MAFSARPTSTDLLTKLVNLNAHGFTIGQVIVYDGAYSLAAADTLPDSAGTMMVSIVPDANSFYVTQTGWVNNIPGPLTTGAQYYLSPTTPGALTLVEPIGVGQVVLPCFVADTTTSGFFFGGSGDEIEAGSLFSWSVITAGQTMLINNGYFSNSGGSLNLALPAASAVGDTIEISNVAGGWTITQAAGQRVISSGAASTLGAGGTVNSNANGDSIKIVCETANTIWYVISNSGTLTYT